MATSKKRTRTEEDAPQQPKKATASRTGAPRPGGARAGATKGAVKRGAAAKRAGAPRMKSSHAAPPAPSDLSDGPRPRSRSVRAPARKAPAAPAAPPRAPLAAPKRAGKRASAAPLPEPSDQARELALNIAAAGLDKKAIGVEILQVAGRVDYTDFLVIMTGRSDRHVHAIATGIEDALRQKKVAALSTEGLTAATWVLIDFGDVVVHVFQEETRRLYDIEGLWMDAGRVPVPGAEAEGSGQPTVTRIITE